MIAGPKHVAHFVNITSLLFSITCALLVHSVALCFYLTRFFSVCSALFRKNRGGRGGKVSRLQLFQQLANFLPLPFAASLLPYFRTSRVSFS